MNLTIARAFIEEMGGRRMEPEMRDVYEELRQRGVPVELFAEKRSTGSWSPSL